MSPVTAVLFRIGCCSVKLVFIEQKLQLDVFSIGVKIHVHYLFIGLIYSLMTGFYDDGGGHTKTFTLMAILSSVSSSLASLMLIYLIHVMKLRNGFTLLILTMSWAQVIYDISFAPAIVTENSEVEGVYILVNILQLMGGIMAAIFSNFLTFVVFHVIKYKKSVDIYAYYPWFVKVSLSFFMMTALLFIIGSVVSGQEFLARLVHQYIYYYFRYVSIAFNFLTCGLSYFYVYQMNSGSTSTLQDRAIFQLVHRMLFYPILQAISRIGSAW